MQLQARDEPAVVMVQDHIWWCYHWKQCIGKQTNIKQYASMQVVHAYRQERATLPLLLQMVYLCAPNMMHAA